MRRLNIFEKPRIDVERTRCSVRLILRLKLFQEKVMCKSGVGRYINETSLPKSQECQVSHLLKAGQDSHRDAQHIFKDRANDGHRIMRNYVLKVVNVKLVYCNGWQSYHFMHEKSVSTISGIRPSKVCEPSRK